MAVVTTAFMSSIKPIRVWAITEMDKIFLIFHYTIVFLLIINYNIFIYYFYNYLFIFEFQSGNILINIKIVNGIHLIKR